MNKKRLLLSSANNNTMIEEIFKDIEGYEGLYQVSNQGRVKSLNYNHTDKEGILKPYKNKWGYLLVVLCKNGKNKRFQIHRLVAQTFLPNPDNLPCVNHKDENRLNNHVNNLEFCSYKYNNNYGTRLERVAEKLSKVVHQYTLDGDFVGEWPSLMEIERQLGYSSGYISNCCNGKFKTAYGYKWSYKNQLSVC